MTPTPEQLAIFDFVRSGEGHGVVDAVAGAGKTTTLVEAMCHVPPGRTALLCAFNKSIQKELKRRLATGGRPDADVRTLHALGLKLLRNHFGRDQPLDIQEDKLPRLYDTADFQTEVTEQLNDLLLLERIDPSTATEHHPRNFYRAKRLLNKVRRRVLASADLARATLMPPDGKDYADLVTHFGTFSEADLAREDSEREVALHYAITAALLRRGEELARERQVIDFTDMIYLHVGWKVEAPYKSDFLFIDECQDLSQAQLATLVKYGRRGTRVIAVGDPKQSVYGFSGADVRSFHRIEERLSAKRLPLSTCFRCPAEVIALAKAFRPDIVGHREEAGVVEEVSPEQLLDSVRPGDLIVSRLKTPLHALLYLLLERDRKVRIHQDDVEGVLLALRSPFTKRDLRRDLSTRPHTQADFFEAVRRRNYEDIERTNQRISDEQRRRSVIDGEQAALDAKLSFLQGRLAAWPAHAGNLSTVLEEFRRHIQAPKSEAIGLCTIHGAKGLENDRVFVLAYDELPYTRPGMREWQAAQELNLQYVAVTRARRELYLVMPEREAEAQAVGEGAALDAGGVSVLGAGEGSLYEALY